MVLTYTFMCCIALCDQYSRLSTLAPRYGFRVKGENNYFLNIIKKHYIIQYINLNKSKLLYKNTLYVKNGIYYTFLRN